MGIRARHWVGYSDTLSGLAGEGRRSGSNQLDNPPRLSECASRQGTTPILAQRMAGQGINPRLVVCSVQETASLGHGCNSFGNRESALLQKLGK